MADDTPFSFHCMICFEVFDVEVRYPVVLPCGHTYVCIVCANRLDKCMECRTPLFINTGGVVGALTANAQQQNNNTRNGGGYSGVTPVRSMTWSSARNNNNTISTSPDYAGQPYHAYRSNNQVHPPPPPNLNPKTTKQRLALPKNVVLLSLIEATELATEDARQPDGMDAGAAMMDYCDDDEEEDSSSEDEAVAAVLDGSAATADVVAGASSGMRSTTPATVGGGETSRNKTPQLEYQRSRSVYEMSSMIDAAEMEEEEKIKVGTSLALGMAGTYAVAHRSGLEIFENRPLTSPAALKAAATEPGTPPTRKSSSRRGNDLLDESTNQMDEEVDELVKRTLQHSPKTRMIMVSVPEQETSSSSEQAQQTTPGSAASSTGAAANGESGMTSVVVPSAAAANAAVYRPSLSPPPSPAVNHHQHHPQPPPPPSTPPVTTTTAPIPSPGSRRSGSPGSPKTTTATKLLSFGDRVQVVSIQGGWAKLARGYGYVQADKNQLVKVGGTVDRACKLEAMLKGLSDKRKNLRREQAKVDNQFIRVMKDLQVSLERDEDLTVILGDTFAETGSAATDKSKSPEISEVTNQQRNNEAASAATPRAGVAATAAATTSSASSRYDPVKPPRKLESPPKALQRRQTQQPSLMCFATDVFSALDGSADDDQQQSNNSGQQQQQRQQLQQQRSSLQGEIRQTLSNNSITVGSALGCGGESDTTVTVSNSNNNAPLSTTSLPNTTSANGAPLFPSASHPSPSAMRAGAQAWRERHGRRASRGRNGFSSYYRNYHGGDIDFRTGMSGHMALLSTHAHPHEYLEQNHGHDIHHYQRQDSAPCLSSSADIDQPYYDATYTTGRSHNRHAPSIPRMSSHTGLTMYNSKSLLSAWASNFRPSGPSRSLSTTGSSRVPAPPPAAATASLSVPHAGSM